MTGACTSRWGQTCDPALDRQPDPHRRAGAARPGGLGCRHGRRRGLAGPRSGVADRRRRAHRGHSRKPRGGCGSERVRDRRRHDAWSACKVWRCAMLPASLLGGRLSVATLRAQRIEFVITPASTPSGQPFRMPRLSVPILVDVDEVNVGALEIRRGESVQTVTGIHLAGSMHETRLKIRRLQGSFGGLELQVAGSDAARAGIASERPGRVAPC